MRSLLVILVAACGGPSATPVQPHDPIAHREPVVLREAALPPEVEHALGHLDPADPSSIEAAIKAADRVAQQRLTAAIPQLGVIAQAPASAKLVAAQIAAIRALGRLGTAPDRAAVPLVAIIERDQPELGKQQFELAITGAAINALAELHAPSALTPLVLGMYRAPALFDQSRRALASYGLIAADAMRQILRGEHAAVAQLFTTHHLDTACVGPDACVPVAARDFYAAVVLGDLRDAKAIPELMAALRRPALPPYYLNGDPAPTTQHHAVFDAIRRIGAPETARPLYAMWSDPKTELATRILAINAFAFVSRDASGIDELGAIASDNAADDQLRQEAATAFSRLARTADAITRLTKLAKLYLDASGKKTKALVPLQAAASTADAVFDKAKHALDDAKTNALKIAHDPAATTAQIRAATKAAETAEDAFRRAKQVHKDKTSEFRSVERAAKDYLGYARMFQIHVARVELAMRCTDEPCLAASLHATPDDLARELAPYITDLAEWKPEELQQLVEAAAERGMIELVKRGPATPAVEHELLDALLADRKSLFPSIVYALPRIVSPPCPECGPALDHDPGIDARIARLYLR